MSAVSNRSIRSGAYAITAALAVLLSLSSCAVVPGSADCGPTEEVIAKLKAEGLQPIATAETTTPSAMHIDDARGRRLIFFTDARGSKGYILQAGGLLTYRPEAMCVHTRMRSVRIYDVRKPNRLPPALAAMNDTDAERQCEKLRRSLGCRSLPEVLRRSDTGHEQRVLMHGESDSRRPDAEPLLVTIVVNASNGAPHRLGRGSILYSTVEGAIIGEHFFTDATYTREGEARLRAERLRP